MSQNKTIKKGTMVMLVRYCVHEGIVPIGAVGVAESDFIVTPCRYKGVMYFIEGWIVDFKHHPHPEGKRWVCAKGTIIPINDPDIDVNDVTSVDNPVKKSKPAKFTEEVK